MLNDAALTATLLEGAEEPDENAPQKPYDLAQHFWLARPAFSDEFAQEVFERFSKHAEAWRTSSTPLTQAVWQAYRTYHGLVDGSGEPTVSLMEAGEEGEFLKLFVNHYRGLVRHQNALATSDRLVWDVQARTSDSQAQKQCLLAQNICEYAVDAKNYAQKFADALEMMRVVAVSFIAQGWNPNAGIKGSGDIWSLVLAPWECAHEDVRSYDDATWHIFVRWESRWEWAAHFAKDKPELAERLAGYDPDDSILCGVETREDDDKATDRIPLLYLYADPSRACPGGRMAILAGPSGDMTLIDVALPYGQKSPIRRMCSAEFLGTSTPIGNSWSMLPIQEAYDAVTSVIMTRIDLFGIPNVFSQDGVEFEASDMGGANSLKVPAGAELPMIGDMLQVPALLPKFGESLENSMEKLSGINSVTRGQPTENITSGSMAALVQAMAQQFNSADERAYVTCSEATATDMIGIYQRMASEPQLISIAGRDERYSAREFKKEDLALVTRVKVKIGNALSRNIAGRREIMTDMLQNGLIKDPREYLLFMQTGEYSATYSGPANELINIKSENEAMSRGEEPPVDLWDNDEIHIREHRFEKDSGVRCDQEASARIDKHLMSHMKNWGSKTRDAPDILAAIGQNPLPAAQQAQQQAAAMQGGAAPPPQPGPPPTKSPNAVEQKTKPGPAPAQKGAEQPQIGPKLPAPSAVPRSPV